VLIRALEPTLGIPLMMERRGQSDPRLLCSGPGRLGQALAVTPALNGQPVDAPPFAWSGSPTRAAVVRGRRIGITKATEHVWRFGLKDSRFVSRPFD
jgi:DNA-3-methyladenine glycosylase